MGGEVALWPGRLSREPSPAPQCTGRGHRRVRDWVSQSPTRSVRLLTSDAARPLALDRHCNGHRPLDSPPNRVHPTRSPLAAALALSGVWAFAPSHLFMITRFIHTADWQLGKPFAGVHDPAKRAALQQERIAMLARIAAAAREHQAEFVVVAGDAFDSPHATKATVAAACSALGVMHVPIYLIPGNHDHGGPGSLWEQAFFRREAAALCPNLQVLLTPAPLEADKAILFPCPLRRRHDSTDTTQWLRSPEVVEAFSSSDKPRIVIAHGSTQSFGSGFSDDDDGEEAGHNLLDLTRLPPGAYDYIALGDWHGTKQIAASAWYAGTPELDRFPKGADHDPGNILLVVAERGAAAQVRRIPTARLGWHQLSVSFADDHSFAQLATQLETRLGQRAGEDLLRLELDGSLGLEATTRLEHLLESYEARLVRLKLINRMVIAPSTEELAALTTRASDPLIARVATKLVARAEGESEEAAIARTALRELHAQIQSS